MSGYGWDLNVYRRAIASIQADRDPYLDAIATQERFYSRTERSTGDPPFNYVYPPLTLPLLRAIGVLPVWLSGSLYWATYVGGVLVTIRMGMLAFKNREKPYLVYFAPVSLFFPGMLANGIVLSGNVAYIFYGLVSVGIFLGYKKNTWSPFYLAVLLSSCFKAPLLSLVVIPVLLARKQWLPTLFTIAAAVAIFCVQWLRWPGYFLHYLRAIQLELNNNRDFGCSPAGLLSGFLHDRYLPYTTASIVFYCMYASAVFACLLYLSRQFLDGRFCFKRWMPVMLVGVVLLNPRLIEYDLAPLTLVLILIGWRFLTSFCVPSRAMLYLLLFLAVCNSIAVYSWSIWKLTEGPALLLFFGLGTWGLVRHSLTANERYSVNSAIGILVRSRRLPFILEPHIARTQLLPPSQ